MTAKQLTDSILQMAIQGKFVPQDPNDAPASVLLEHIREEKKRLVKEGKLKKKDLEETPISEEEQPFKIPESWEWCRMTELFSITSGLSYKKDDLVIQTNDMIRVLRGGNISFGQWEAKPDDIFIASQFVDNSLYLKKDTFITPAVSSLEHMGKTALIRKDIERTVVGGFILMLSPFFTEGVLLGYLNYMFQSYYYRRLCQSLTNKSGQAFYNLSRTKLLNAIIPLPPLAEQHRIVEKIEELMPIIKEYGEAYDEASKMDAELPDKLKKSILQEAIMGKLDTQDPNDEPASVLLEHIREEKKRLVKEGKLKKKDLIETPVEESEQPFKIPESWEWCKIFNCIDVLYGYPFDSQKFNEEKNGAPLIRIRDIIPSSTNTYTTEVVEEKYIIKSGDMLVGMDGNFNVRFWEGRNAYLNQRVCKITAKNKILSQRYLFYYLPFALNKIFEDVSYTTVKHLSDKHLRRMNIPLPPLSEQHRIVEKIEALFSEIDNMTINDITTNEEETKEIETE